MRKLILVCWIGVMTTGTLVAQQPVPAPPPAAAEPWANKLFGGVTTKDFGTVAKGTQLKYTFKVTNIYKVPLEITDIRVTCGCVTATPVPRTLQPNETGALNITMDGRRVVGHKKIDIFVKVGPQFISTATLSVQATTRQDVVFNPGEIDFGVLQRGSMPVKFIDVEYTGNGGWRLDEIVKNANAPFNLEVKELTKPGGFGAAPKQVGYRIQATIKPDAPTGQFNESILLKTNDTTSPVLTFAISGNVQATLRVDPPQITFNPTSREQKVVVHGNRPFKIQRIDGQGQGVVAIADNDRVAPIHIITIRCQTDQLIEMRRTLVVVSSQDNESAPIAVDLKP